jgi:hypothetical protein
MPMDSRRFSAPHNAFKLMRPGFGPAAEPPRLNSTSAASRRLQFGCSLTAAAGAPRCRSHAGPAAQLNVER